MKKTHLSFCLLSLAALSACVVDPLPPTPHPDYAIMVMPTAQGSVALPPPCMSWSADVTDPYDNQVLPQFGCASARNLALMVENPDDLLTGRTLAPARGVTEVGAIRRYDNNQPRGLITPAAEVSQVAVTSAPASASALTGDVTGGAGSSSSSPAAAAAAP